MICTKCGKEILAANKFCQNCGAVVAASPEPQRENINFAADEARETKIKKGMSKGLIVLIIVVSCFIIAGGLFKIQILSFAYGRLSEMNKSTSIDKAISYAEKAFELDSGKRGIVASLYVKKAEDILEQDLGQAIELLLVAKSYINDNSLDSRIADVYLKDAEKKMEFDVDAAINQIDVSVSYANSGKTADLYAQAYLAKADKTTYTDIDAAIDFAKKALEYKQTDTVKGKIIELYLKKAEHILDYDPQSAGELATESKIYGQDSRIDQLIQKANAKSQANMISSMGNGTESQMISDLIYNYAKAMSDAVNFGDFSYVESYLVYESNLYNTQKEYIANIFSKNLKEEFVNAYVKSYEYDPVNNLYRVYVYEEYNITYESGKVENKGFDWIYTARLQPEYGLIDIFQ